MKKLLIRMDNLIYERLFTRKLLHLVGGGLIIFALIYLDRLWLFLLGITYFVAALTVTKRFTLTILAVLFLLAITDSKFSTAGGTTIWVAGDGLSALIGSTLGKKKWPWNKQKSVVGSVAFMAGGILAVSLLLQVNNVNDPSSFWLLTFVPTLIGCVLEAISNPKIAGVAIGDNAPVIMGSGLAFHALSTILKVTL